ncbi:MAG TPA: glycosyltransferase [Candidatus Blautia excrementipullorum]|nr:glycosyltransferase [Candidatus Blautia excrementipullorum]
MKKKIMLIVPMLHQGGFERVCVATARLLEPYYEVYIVIFSAMDIAYDIRGLHVIDIHMKSVEGKAGKILNVFRRAKRVAALKREYGIEIAYSFGPTANLVNVFSGMRPFRKNAAKRTKIWCGVRSYMDMGNPGLLRLFCRHSDRVVSCSRLIQRELEARFSCRKVCTLYNPFDLEAIRSQSKEIGEKERLPFAGCGRVIVSMGRQDDVKGFWHLLKSFSLLHRKYEDIRLLIVGEGDFKEYWKLAEDLGISDAVSFPGVKKNPFPYLALGRMYVMTSINEGFPNVLVEAMALGIPVISTNCMTGPAEILAEDFDAVSGRQEYLDADYGILIPVMEEKKNLDSSVITEEERKLAGQMERLLSDEALHEKYSRAAVARAAQFSGEAYVERIRGMAEE